MFDLATVIARALQANDLRTRVSHGQPENVGIIDVQTQIMDASKPGEGQILLTYGGVKHAINVERWEGYVE